MLIQHYSPSTGYRVQSASIVTYTKGNFTQIQTIKRYRPWLISLACQTPQDMPEYFVKALLPATSASNGAGIPQTRQQISSASRQGRYHRTRGEGWTIFCKKSAVWFYKLLRKQIQ